jgi:hypothetical protein
MNNTQNGQKPYEQMSTKERIVVTTSTKLLQHFRGLESSGMMDKETASNFIGCIKKLTAIANGDNPLPKTPLQMEQA